MSLTAPARPPEPPAQERPSSDRLPLARLRRGTVVQVRGDGLLQVGSDPTRRALLPDTNSVRGLLHLLHQGARLEPGPGTDGVVAALREAGVLVEPEVDSLLDEARACTLVHVEVPAPWLDVATAAIRTAGLSLWSARGASEVPDLVLRWGAGSRGASAAPAAAEGCEPAVLHVRTEDSRIRVGPFVSVGDTACPECIEAHLRDRDAYRPIHVTSPERTLLPHTGSDGTDLDALQVQHALILAADDLRAWAEGRQPRNWSATTWVDRTLNTQRRAWAPHPSCGCTWQPSA